ncbi:MAG: RND transporter, partial [Gammaproteobacteria bacterium]
MHGIFLAIILLLSSCSLAPTYERPEMEVPNHYKEMGEWVLANPNAAKIDRGKWWELYGDPQLNALAEQVTIGNQDLKLAVARYDQAC